MKKIINIGLIGCGIVGIKRINNLPKKFRLIACSDIKKENFKNISKKNILFTKNWKELLRFKDLDAVIIATTHHLHSKILCESIRLNIHAFVEKPGGISSSAIKKKGYSVYRVLMDTYDYSYQDINSMFDSLPNEQQRYKLFTL